MNGRRYYVVSSTGEQGPFSREELQEALVSRSVMAHDQVRSALGSTIGTVEEVLAKPSDAASPWDQSSPSPVAVGGIRWLPIVVLAASLLPALALILLLRVSNQPAPFAPAPSASPAPPSTGPVTTVTPAPTSSTNGDSSKPSATTVPGRVVVPQADGSLLLKAEEAVIHGTTVQLGFYSAGPSVGRWLDVNDHVSWTIRALSPGRFRVLVRYGCPWASAGSDFSVTVGTSAVVAKVKHTPGWEHYIERDLGSIRIDAAGEHQLVLQPRSKPAAGVMNLNQVLLVPERTFGSSKR